ncbi:MAG: phage baseplate protein [Actinomycetota bacterium]|nr:phage baseplate protein [Actinomycetota bacterium]
MSVAWEARLSDRALLSAWDSGTGRRPAQRALCMLAQVAPPEEREELGDWTVGQRDARLLDLYAATFGERVEGMIPCPACGETLEVAFGVGAVRVPHDESGTEHRFEDATRDYKVVFRVPTSADLVAATVPDDPVAARALVIRRCVVRAEHRGTAVTTATLPEEVILELGARMAAADSQAALQLSLVCPTCGEASRATFDVADFVWRELEGRAHQLLRQIASLAAAFGWDEGNILSLSRARRQLYLDMVGA